ncbi:hypothetical protein RI367_001505 [Sorochytrium milnesiophthora]
MPVPGVLKIAPWPLPPQQTSDAHERTLTGHAVESADVADAHAVYTGDSIDYRGAMSTTYHIVLLAVQGLLIVADYLIISFTDGFRNSFYIATALLQGVLILVGICVTMFAVANMRLFKVGAIRQVLRDFRGILYTLCGYLVVCLVTRGYGITIVQNCWWKSCDIWSSTTFSGLYICMRIASVGYYVALIRSMQLCSDIRYYQEEQRTS